MNTHSRSRMPGRLLALVAIPIAAVLVLSACATSSAAPGAKTAGAADAAPVVIKAAPSVRNQDLGYWAAVDNGYFKAANVDVQSTELETRAAALTAVIADQVQLAHVSINTSLPAFEKKSPIISAAAVFETFPLVGVVSDAFLKKQGITPAQFEKLSAKKKFQELKGARFGLYTPGDLLDQTIRAQFTELGISKPDSFVTFAYLQTLQAQEANYSAGGLDVLYTDEPDADWIIDHTGGSPLLSGKQQAAEVPDTTIPAGNYIVNTQWLKQSPSNAAALKRFLAAWQRGNDWVRGLSEAKLRTWILTKGYPTVTDKTAQDRLVAVADYNRRAGVLTADGRLKDALIKRVIDFAAKRGTISTELPVSTVRDWSYLPAAKG